MITDTAELEGLFVYCKRQRNRCGPALFQVASNAAQEKNPDLHFGALGPATVAEIDAIISRHSGDARFMTDKVWEQTYNSAEEESQRKLFEGSSEMRESDKLNRQASESRRLADQAEAGLRLAWNEFLSLPEAVEKLRATLEQIAHERQMLDPGALKLEYQRLYLHGLKNPQQDLQAQELAMLPLLITSDWRREVLDKLHTETLSKLETLKKRNSELSRKLGRPPHKLHRD